MEPEVALAPPVVALVVVHDPGVWFDESVAALAAQDYPNLRLVFLVTGGSDEAAAARISDTVQRLAPDAFVTELDDNPGFGAAANQVQELVEGDNGFFLLCHDDIAPDRDAVTRLVEELYRSNAGIVGPKLVEWDAPAVLQHVGLGLDRFGEVDPIIEPEEVDQEQHDGVRDVFAVPTACMLVRADLFRTLSGFDPAVEFHGDDVDLCWRAHFSGARVIVVPAARVRHRGALEQRRPDLNHRVLRARHRMRSVATLTGIGRLPLRSIELVFVTFAEMIVGLFTGRFQEAWASMRALIGLIPRTPAIIARRLRVSSLRSVPEPEVIELQVRGSSRLSSYLRTRDTMTYVGADSSVRRWRPTGTAPTIAWVVVIAVIAFGSRQFVTSGVPGVGEFLPFPDSAGDLLAGFRSGWNPDGFGASSPNPTGWGIISLLSVGTAFQMGLAHTVAVVGLLVAGLVGAGRVGSVFPSTRARLASFIVYGALPLASGMLATGRWSGLVAYAAVPWFVHLVRRAAGVGTADPRLGVIDLVDGQAAMSRRDRVRLFAYLGLLAGVAGAFAPVVVLLLVAVGVVLAASTVLAAGSVRTAGWMLAGSLVTGVLGIALNLPWSATWTWDTMTLAETAGPQDRGLLDVITFGLADDSLAVLAVALYLPLVAALVLASAWRLTWAIRAAMLTVVFGGLAVLVDRGTIGGRLPDIGIVLAPVALGLAIGAAAALAAFEVDVRGTGFGWRQPLGILAGVATVVGLVPGVVAAADGAWGTPTRTLESTLRPQLPSAAQDGEYRVLYLGDPSDIPVPARTLRDGVAYAVVDDGPLDVRDRWLAADTVLDDRLRDVVDALGRGQISRFGRFLAPLGVRYVVVVGAPPLGSDGTSDDEDIDDATSDPGTDDGGTDADADASGDVAATSLIAELERQLDLRIALSPPETVVFENAATIPLTAMLTGPTAEASSIERWRRLIAADLSDAEPLATDVAGPLGTGGWAIESRDGTLDSAGVVHLAVEEPDDWALRLGDDATTVEPRSGFGVTTAFDIDEAGLPYTISYRGGSGRSTYLLALAALWLVTMLAASRIRSPLRRRARVSEDATLIDLGSDRDEVALDELLATESHGGWIDDVLGERADQAPKDEQRGGAV